MAEAEQTASIRVFLVDDHGVVRRGMRAYLEFVEDLEVLGEAEDGRQALDRLAALAATGGLPDVVLMDLLMPRMDGIAATAAIKAQFPDIEVVALTSFIEEEKVHAALAAGAAGYLLKDAEADEIA
ncbi:MAG: response regulator transcription factor, partial [Rhodospirillales bacterium]|nr:response regulator transcription factor [Rhodospirillales bacterium]